MDSFFQIPGVLYQCAPEYVQRTLLDPLAQFVLDALDDERSIPRLFNSFGLPPRVLEDILGDLVRLNLASLDLARREVHPTKRAIPVRQPEVRRPLELWQDGLTGAVLEWGTIRRSHREGPVAADRIQPDNLVDDFLDLPHGRIIGMLERSRSYTVEDREGWRLERLLERRRLRVQPIYVSARKATFKDGEATYLNAPSLPAWVVRAWSRGLERTGRHNAAVRMAPERAAEGNWWNLAAVEDEVRSWKELAEVALQRQPPPQSAGDLAPLWRAFDSVIGRLRRQATVRIVSGSGRVRESWLSAAFTRAESYVVVTLPSEDEKWLRYVKDALQQLSNERDGRARPLRLWVLRPVKLRDQNWAQRAQSLRQSAKHTAAECHLLEFPVGQGRAGCPTQPPSGFVAVADGHKAWVGLTADEREPTALLEIDGDDAVQRLVALAQEWGTLPQQTDDTKETRESLSVLIATPHRPKRVILTQGRDKADADADKAALTSGADERLAGVRRDFFDALASVHRHDREIAPSRRQVNDTVLRPSATLPTAAERQAIRLRPLGERHPHLREQVPEAANAILAERSCGRATWSFLDNQELDGLIADALAYPLLGGSQGEIVIVSPTLGTVASSPDFVAALRTVLVERGWRVMIVWGRSADASTAAAHLTIARQLQEAVSDARLSLKRIDQQVPFAAILVNGLVGIGLVDWLGRPSDGSFAYVFDSPTLRDQLTELVRGARGLKEIAQP